MKKPSKRVREQAIQICAIGAANPHCWYAQAAASIGAPEGKPQALAAAAWSFACRETGYRDVTSVEMDAEAQCLLIEGWCP